MADQSPSSQGGQSSVQPGHGNISAAEIERYIRGVDFPADKENLVQQARENNAPNEVVDLMNDFPERKYESAADVARGISEAKH